MLIEVSSNPPKQSILTTWRKNVFIVLVIAFLYQKRLVALTETSIDKMLNK